ncbi:hypothetical protein NDU88_004522 [Pleurodeles waltl]|uniref:PRRP protein n=1 Tax=Pleurodeles waltl TaxID=8319 RepID=A0AAV7UFQ7_PLEWA|nr:hypothetical protein NDU88_004522 [Pleurodeles waltl]
MKLLVVCLLCLLLTSLALPSAESRMYQRSMDIRNPDIDPSWYTGRGIRPVGRFGRRGVTEEVIKRPIYRRAPQACIALEDSSESYQEE